jgi:putative endopeptidase
MHRVATPSLALIALLAACGGGNPPAADPAVPVAGAAPADLASRPIEATTLEAVGLDPAALDRSADPCDDYFQYACGGWLAATEIPPDKGRYGRFAQIDDRNELQLRTLLDDAASRSRGAGALDPVTRALGDYYGACMDEAAVERAGTRGIDPLLAVIRKVRDRRSLERALIELQGATVAVPFALAVDADFKDATRNVAFFTQAGLGLPDRDYYLKDDEPTRKARAAYQAHLARTFALLGVKGKAGTQAAADVLELERRLATAQRPREEMRDAEKIYNKVDRAGLARLMPGFDLGAYLTSVDEPALDRAVVTAPGFLTAVDGLLASVSPAVWQRYLTYHVVRRAADTLPKRFVDEMFSLTQALSGVAENRPRWKRCIDATDAGLGEYLGQPFVARSFGPEAKDAASTMVTEISKAFAGSVDSLAWMSAATKAKAKAKLAMVTYLVGYPATWKTYDFKIDRGNWTATALAAARFEQRRELAKIGQPYDRSEWHMTPQTVNAYYSASANQMVFPAGILQPPFFAARAHVAVNLGAIGMVVGHELTHGFDDDGAKFAGDGNMSNWWTAADLAEFQARGTCVARQYSSYDALPGLKINGAFTLGENIADIGGVKIAFKAYRNMRARAAARTVADGFSEDQMFFLAVGQAWCSKQRDEESRRRVLSDPHAPPNDRVNGALSDSRDFAAAFSCKPGSRMAPVDACEVW